MASATSSSALLRFFTAIFLPPFRGLPFAIFAYFALCFVAHPHSLIMQGNLPDSDDYMYLDQLRDWLSGQSWYDNVQHRLNPVAGVFIDFSRVTELPMAGLVYLLRIFLAPSDALIVMAALFPLILFALLLATLSWAAQPFMDAKWTRITGFIGLFASYLVFQFSPGHIDHHGLTALLVLAGFGFAARVIRDPGHLAYACGAGFVLGLALVVALEVLPPLIFISGWLGLLAMIRGGKSGLAGAVFGLTLCLSAAAFLALTKEPQAWLVADMLGYSIVYVLFTVGLAVCLSGIYLASLTPYPSARYVIGALLAATTGFAFLSHFPALILGPYGAMNPALSKLMFDSISEAIPITRSATSALEVFLRLIWPLMGFVAALFFLRTARKSDERWLWSFAAFMLAAHLLLAVFYQIRFMVLAQLFTILPLSAVLPAAFKWIKRNEKGAAIGFLQIELLLLIAPLPMVLLPALVDGRPFNTGVVLFPVDLPPYVCDMRSAALELRRTDLYGTAPHLLMNEMETGPELLFRTQDAVLGAPYHTNVSGNLDAAAFFGATDLLSARKVMTARGADLVVLCRKMIPLYPRSADGKMTLAERLGNGEVPPWLTSVSYKGSGDYLLFALRK